MKFLKKMPKFCKVSPPHPPIVGLRRSHVAEPDWGRGVIDGVIISYQRHKDRHLSQSYGWTSLYTMLLPCNPTPAMQALLLPCLS